MNPALDEFVARLGLALLQFVWQGALIGCVAAVGLALLRNARPQARYALCTLAMLLCVSLPVWQVFAPHEFDVAAAANAVVATPVHTVVVPLPTASASADALHRSLPVVVLVWSLGAALMSLRLVLGLAWVQRIGGQARSRVHPLDGVWNDKLAALGRRMGLRRLPLLRAIEGLDGPITVGRWRPLILLPASLLTRLPPEMIEALLAHELAHIRRLDYVANLLQSIVEALLFYHPVVWWLSHRIRTEREQIADDLATAALGEPLRLARALSELSRYQSDHPSLALAAQGGSLVDRIRRLVRPTPQPLGWKLVIPVSGLALALAAHAAGLTSPASPVAPSAPSGPSATAAPATPAVGATPATRTAPATPATPDDHGESIRLTLADDQPLAYALVWGGLEGHAVMSGNDKDMRELKAKRSALRSDFLWIRQGRQRYVVTDPAALAEARALWEPVRAFDADMDKLSAKIDEQAQVLEKRAQEIEAAHEAPSAEVEVLQARMTTAQANRDKAQAAADRLSRKMSAVRDEKQLSRMEQELERLEKAIEPLDEALQALSEKLDQLSDAREQAIEQAMARHDQEADKKLEELSRQMEGLSQKQEAATRQAEQRLRVMIQDLIKRGLARQA